MIAVDTNILVYANRVDSPFYVQADACITSLAESGASWAIPWPCLYEFLTVVTHPRIYKPSTPLKEACLQLDYLLQSPNLHLIGEDAEYWVGFRELIESSKITGPQIHDAKIAAICLQNNVRTLWTC